MVRINTAKQQKDLILALIEIRKNPEIVNSYGGDFDFKTIEFSSGNFSSDEDAKFDEIVKALEIIIEDKGIIDPLSHQYVRVIEDIVPNKEAKIIKIIGATTPNLTSFLTQRFNLNANLATRFERIPIPVPSDFKWEDIKITFTNDYDVKIDISGRFYNTSFVEMGFGDKRRVRDEEIMEPRQSWRLLNLFAINHGEINLNNYDGQQKGKIKKQKQELSKFLKLYFSIINEDPFFPTQDGIYKIKLNLIPEEEFRADPDHIPTRGRELREPEIGGEPRDFDSYY